MRTFKHNTLLLFMLVCTMSTFSQAKKLDKTYSTSRDVKIIIDSRHTNIAVENWDRNEVQIEAFIDGPGGNTADSKKLLERWKLETSFNNGTLVINSGGGAPSSPEMDVASINESMGQLQNLIAPIMSEMVAPMLENIAKNPPLPPDFAAKMGNLSFDYEAYQKDGEKYMKKWEKQIEKNFGKDFEASMEEWAAQFEENAEVWGENLEREMEVNGEKFEQSMEKWAESFGAQMEQWGANFAHQMEGKEPPSAPGMSNASSTKSHRNIRIKIPAGAQLNLEVRHGEVKLGQRTTNLKANLSHSKLTGTVIDGDKTEVKASYSPINIAQWNYGVLNASYVQQCAISKVRSIKLLSNSSDVEIGELAETGILSGSFGALKIGKLSPAFKNLDITLKNSDLELSLPKTALNFNYNGNQSSISYPKVPTVKSTSSYDNQLLHGYYQSGNAERNISINATFSEIEIK